jgi:transcriptional regulator with XRE-family HTH domain
LPDKEFLVALGSRIRKIRLEKKLSQVELADLCNIEKASMSRIEAGKASPSIITLRKISVNLNVPLMLFFTD